MDHGESRALVPLGGGRLVAARAATPALRVGTRALVGLARLARLPAVRRAAFMGVAFGVGFQLSRALRSGQLPALASTARDVYRSVSGDDREAEGRLVGRWVRESLTVISTVSERVDRNES